DFLARFPSDALDVRFHIRELAMHRAQVSMGAVGIQRVFRAEDETTAIRDCQFKFLGDSYGLIGRCFRAQAAEYTQAVINRNLSSVSTVANRYRPGRTHFLGGSRILPFFEIEARPSAKVFGDFSRLAGIGCC